MHDIEPYHKWRGFYIAAEDEKSVYKGTIYNEFTFTKKVYNYFIHPQWDTMGSQTLYVKIIYADYDEGYAFIELIGEWNDCLHNDVMFLKRKVADNLMHHGITKFILLCDNVLEFHGSDDSYYEEWWDDVKEEEGWIILLNTREHILAEMEQMRLQHYVHIGHRFNEINWRTANPKLAYRALLKILGSQHKQLSH